MSSALAVPEVSIPRKRGSEEIPSLNGLRAVSIALVIVSHATASGRSFLSHFLFQHGGLGVRVFFLISGYLITTLLLREKALFGNVSLRLFYLRRAIRILPAFYVYVLCIAILAALGVITLPPHNLLYVLTYTVNFITNGNWWTGHLWSLSVEEQFYLLWPLAMRFCSRGFSFGLAIAAVFAGIIIRAVSVLAHVSLVNPEARYSFPFVCGTIAVGCLLALSADRVRTMVLSSSILRGSTVLVLIPVVLLVDTLDLGTANRFTMIFADLMLALLMARFTFVPGDLAARFLNSKPLVFVGKLSYSLYLWQELAFQHWTNWRICQFPWNIGFTLVAACSSYFLLERPFLRLRSAFRRKTADPDSSQTSTGFVPLPAVNA